MRKVKISLALLLATTLLACGGSEENSNDFENQESIENVVVNQGVELKLFTREKLEGTWKATDASEFSKDKIIGQVYKFEGDSATFYKTTGDGRMATGYYQIIDGLLSIQLKSLDASGMTSTSYTEYNGGIDVNGLAKLEAMNEKITFEKN